MIALGKIINSALSNNSAVAALVADRIYPDVIPQEIERPSISYEVGSLPGIDGSAPVYGTTVVVSCFAREKTAAHGVAAVVDAVLSDLRGAADGVELRSMSRSSYQDGYDPDLDAYAVVLTYSAMLVLTADANTTWANVPAASIDHGSLGGLDDDDHPQYLLRTDYTPGGGDADTLQGHPANYFEVAGAASSAIASHVAAANPHVQYLLIANFVPAGSSGQVLYNNAGAWAGSSGFTYNGSGTAILSTALVINAITLSQANDIYGQPALVVNKTIISGGSGLQLPNSASIILGTSWGSGVLSFQNGPSVFGEISVPASRFSFNLTARFLSPSPGLKAAEFRGYTGQSANIAEFQNSAGTTLAAISATGALIASDIRPVTNAVDSGGFSTASGTRFVSVDTANKRVGFGTNTPSCILDVYGNGTTAIATIYGYSSVAYSTGMSVGFTAQGTSYHSALSGIIYSGAGAGATTPAIYGLSFKAAHGDASNVTSLIGVEATAQKSGANVGNTTFAIGLSPALNFQSAGTPTTTSNAYLIKGSVVKTGVDLINTMYGIYLPDISIGVQNYSIYTNAGDIRLMAGNTDKIGFHGVTPVARQLLATGAGHTVDDVIQILQNLGLARQS